MKLYQHVSVLKLGLATYFVNPNEFRNCPTAFQHGNGRERDLYFIIFDREIHIVGRYRENVDLNASSDLVMDLADSLEQCCS